MNSKKVKIVILSIIAFTCIVSFFCLDVSLGLATLLFLIPYVLLDILFPNALARKLFSLIVLVLGLLNVLPSAISLTGVVIQNMRIPVYRYFPCVVLLVIVAAQVALVGVVVSELLRKKYAPTR